MIRRTVLLMALVGCTPAEHAVREVSQVALRAPAPASPVQVEPPLPQVLGDGLGVADIRVGSGPVAERGRKVVLEYVGITEDGVEFATSAGKTEPFSFVLGDHGVNAIWEKGIDGMRMGGARRIWIPPELINGGRGRPPVIPPGVTLIFDVELLEVR